jgi:hypothetical protein
VLEPPVKGGGEAEPLDDLEFLNKFQRVLNEGLFTASYKYALILALAELSVERAPAADGSLAVPLRVLSERFIALYWRQSAPFANGALLAQNTGRPATVVTRLFEFRADAPTLAAARKHPGWSKLVSDVARVLRGMPLWKLQRVGNERLDFLYEHKKLVDGAVILLPGVAAAFQRQFTIVQALVQMAWLTFVQRLNGPLLGSSGDLAEFLFGAERAGLRAIVDGLTDLQKGACFYCTRPMRGTVAVDHFIPWSRYPRDLAHNFVLVHASCNQSKRDMLAAPAHLERWVARTDAHGDELREIFEAARFVFDADASMSIAEWSYQNAEHARALVWVRGTETCRLSSDWRRAFIR